MGNDPSKRSAAGTHDEDDDADGPVRIGGQRKKNVAEEAAAAESEHATLGGHTPYHAALSALSPPPPVSSDSGGGGGGGNGRAPQSFSEDRHSDAAYASLDDVSSLTGSSTPVTPATSSGDGPVSIGGGKKRIEGDIVQVSRAADDSAALLHPEVEALLSFAQFYPQDAGLATVAAPQGALNITPVLMRPRAVMDVYAALAQRWSGVGASAARAQVLVGKEMDKLEASVQQVLPAVMERQAQIKALNQELAQRQWRRSAQGVDKRVAAG
jgi:hypothetical protein